jgi:hypothetical protein
MLGPRDAPFVYAGGAVTGIAGGALTAAETTTPTPLGGAVTLAAFAGVVLLAAGIRRRPFPELHGFVVPAAAAFGAGILCFAGFIGGDHQAALLNELPPGSPAYLAVATLVLGSFATWVATVGGLLVKAVVGLRSEPSPPGPDDLA